MGKEKKEDSILKDDDSLGKIERQKERDEKKNERKE